MDELDGFQRRHLRGLAHPSKPVVMIGKEGLTEAVVAKTDAELLAHELIKIRFQAAKDEKKEILRELARQTLAELVGVVGHVGILFRQNWEPEKRHIQCRFAASPVLGCAPWRSNGSASCGASRSTLCRSSGWGRSRRAPSRT